MYTIVKAPDRKKLLALFCLHYKKTKKTLENQVFSIFKVVYIPLQLININYVYYFFLAIFIQKFLFNVK